MYPKKTLSAASLLSECERKRRRSLEARGCAKSESEFSMGTAAACPFKMSEQSPRTIKLHHQYVHEVTNRHYDKMKFLPAMLHEMLNPGDSLGNLGYRGSIGAAHISFAALAKGIARHQSHMLLHEKLFRKFLRG